MLREAPLRNVSEEHESADAPKKEEKGESSKGHKLKDKKRKLVPVEELNAEIPWKDVRRVTVYEF